MTIIIGRTSRPITRRINRHPRLPKTRNHSPVSFSCTSNLTPSRGRIRIVANHYREIERREREPGPIFVVQSNLWLENVD